MYKRQVEHIVDTRIPKQAFLNSGDERSWKTLEKMVIDSVKSVRGIAHVVKKKEKKNKKKNFYIITDKAYISQFQQYYEFLKTTLQKSDCHIFLDSDFRKTFFLNCCNVGLIAVSYTHLDVYKRQT